MLKQRVIESLASFEQAIRIGIGASRCGTPDKLVVAAQSEG
jgi:hypothetical protein